jgi:hypothetical protein
MIRLSADWPEDEHGFIPPKTARMQRELSRVGRDRDTDGDNVLHLAHPSSELHLRL